MVCAANEDSSHNKAHAAAEHVSPGAPESASSVSVTVSLPPDGEGGSCGTAGEWLTAPDLQRQEGRVEVVGAPETALLTSAGDASRRVRLGAGSWIASGGGEHWGTQDRHSGLSPLSMYLAADEKLMRGGIHISGSPPVRNGEGRDAADETQRQQEEGEGEEERGGEEESSFHPDVAKVLGKGGDDSEDRLRIRGRWAGD